MNSAAVILAAGFSTRMGTDKALLDLGGRTALERLVSSYQNAGVSQIVVVTGQNDPQLRRLPLAVAWVRNPEPEIGMFSSVQAGVRRLTEPMNAVFVQPVDTPLVSSATLELLQGALVDHAAVAGVVPQFEGRRGHPPLLRTALCSAILGYSGEGGLRGLLEQYPLFRCDCSDQAVLLGMNTPEEYQRLRVYAAVKDGRGPATP